MPNKINFPPRHHPRRDLSEHNPQNSKLEELGNGYPMAMSYRGIITGSVYNEELDYTQIRLSNSEGEDTPLIIRGTISEIYMGAEVHISEKIEGPKTINYTIRLL